MSPKTLPELLEEIERRKEEWQRLQPVARERLEAINKKIRIEWNFNSNAIEGNRITLGETRALIGDNITPAGRSFEEVRDIHGHDRAITTVYDWIARKMELTETAIRDLHKVLLVEEYDIEAQTESGQKIKKRVGLGRYKEQPNFVEIDGKRSLYALPQDTPAQMHELLAWYRGCEKNSDSILVASVFHHRFTRIHPFDDGNGRMGRLLLNFVLMERGYPPVVLKVSEREAYISALRAADADQSANVHIIRFIAEAEIASLDLHCRGARGEKVEEITDLDKEILLLKQQLTKGDQPQPKTKENMKACFEHSISPLLIRAVQKLRQFNELFSESSVHVSSDHANSRADSDGEKLIPWIQQFFSGDPRLPLPRFMQLNFIWKGFKRNGLNVFDHNVSLNISFEDLRWQISNPRRYYMYQQSPGEDDLREIVDSLVRNVLNKIKTEITEAQAGAR
jgi:Fic family protein